ncbi:hypothetical protein [Pseudoalteromonas sp. OOF1S-7]|uniref:hypothetical protein n=1 Tax=Pseudoalteromonas sp. OOF1S-7 TaxID=2917757 RepID=UPI001EF44898|nr:hypothetical protein [Pseudoalteromonas sp. OOF1S-7]MCG7534150.1 hypothetical protein [Pseudoalteromonas sp. OOF1S-7]
MYDYLESKKRAIAHPYNNKESIRRGTIQRQEGLAGLFGLELWVPTGAPNPTRADFQNLLNGGTINADQLMAVIPAGLENTFEIGPRTQRGFKFEWGNWHVHGHEADAGAHAGHVGGAGWIVRIRDGNQWLLSQPLISDHPVGHVNYFAPTSWAAANGQFARAHSHIPLDVD